MKFTCVLFVLGLLRMATFTAVSCDTLSDVTRYRAVREDNDDVPRVKIKVFRGPTEERDGELFATWGYWIKQPSK